jgi:hypothetical protein
MGMVERKHNLKMFRKSSLKSQSPYEEGEQDAYPESGSLGKSKLDRSSYTLPSITASFRSSISRLPYQVFTVRVVQVLQT